MRKVLVIFILILEVGLISGQNKFSFIFLPDIHLEPDSAVLENFNRIVKKVNKIKPDFIITGGDMIYTAKNVDDKKAEVLFNLMDEKFMDFKMPLYYTMGNHELVGIMPNSGIEKSHPKWGKRLYQQRYGARYKSFTKSGWNFFLLDGIKILEKEMNYGLGVDSTQMDWIKDELGKTDKLTPIIISIHSPLVSPKAITNVNIPAVTENAGAVLDLFEEYNLKMVLQGHNHTYMNLNIGGVHYISGGSTLERSNQYNEGFLLVNVKKKSVKLKFISTTNINLK